MLVHYLLPVLYMSSVMTSPTTPIIDPVDPPVTEPPPPGRRKPEIPSLEDLQRGVGTGDPSDHFNPVIQMENGKIKEQSREQLEQYNIHHSSEHDGFGEGREFEMQYGQIAYQHLIKALEDGEEEAANRALTAAAKYMEENGLTLEDAQNEAGTGQNEHGDRDKRYLLKQNNALWDKCIIPFEYKAGFDGASNVIPPMETYEYYTGFRFVEWNESVPSLYGLSHSNRIVFESGGGCWSYVGNLRWNGQPISCCSGSTCIHEIGHAIGFMHEQQSPLRDDYLRIKWDGIDTDYWSQYTRTNKAESELFGYYDPTSVMHYWNGGFGVNYKDTFTTMDPDRDFLVTRDTRYYYFFKEAMASHNCWDLFCNEEIQCENGGYPSVMEGKCSCMCPRGLDPDTRCTTKEKSDASLENSKWPAGSFTTLNTVDGCPAGFVSGWQYHTPPNYVWGSTPYHAKPNWSWWHAEHEFCSRIDETNDGEDWPAGTYCIFRKGGSCPSGFESGYIQMDDAAPNRGNTTGGELPDGIYGDNTRWEFCCRSDGSVDRPIKLPVEEPFILFSDYNCQAVDGMASISEYFSWRSDTADNYVEYGGSLPYIYKFTNELFNLYFCYYTPINTDCGDLYTLDSSHKTTPLNIRSPNYPSQPESNIVCTYTVLAPENTKLQVDFEDFELDCSGNLEIAFSMPGHPGNSFCGNGFAKTIVSSENYVRLTLTSGDSSTGKGFSANVKLLDDSNSCYTHGDEDRSYSSDVSYTKNFEPCLPWNEVQNCRFHRFSPETFDDDLSENFCRNTALGTGPWCYTNAETCARDYCDACRAGNCYDIFNDCADLIANDQQFCSTNLDGQALKGCRKSCGQCKSEIEVPVTCKTPGTVDSITIISIQSSFSVGDKVTYYCPDGSEDKRVRTCTSDGTWTDLGFVCGACPEGWGMVDGKCYKWIDETKTRYDAQSFCENLDSTLAAIISQKQLDYIRKIVHFDKEENDNVWIGLKRTNGQYETWDDGTDVTFSQWAGGEPSSWGDCVRMSSGGQWQSYSCTYQYTFVCSYTPSERTTCADQSSNCEAYIRATPDLCVRHTDFARANCPYSCGVCKRSEITDFKGMTEQSECADQSGNCEAFVLATPDLCDKEEDFAYEYCRFTCDMCTEERHTAGKRDADEFRPVNQWINVREMPEKRQPVKRAFDDCDVVVPTTTSSTTTTSTTTTSPTTSTTTTSPTTSTTTTSPTTSTTTTSPTTSTTTTSPTTSTTTPTTSTTTTSPTTSTTTTSPTTSTTTSPIVSGSCSDPGLPADATHISSAGEITTGQIYEYVCNGGYALASGDLIRACLITGKLTGSEPSCKPEATVEEPVNNVNIRRRSSFRSSGYVYTAKNQDLTITKTGKLTKWQFYSVYDGDISLQVWRFSVDSTSSATFIGENTITGTGTDRVRTVEIPEEEQIVVQAGDVLAVHYHNDNSAGIPYTRCDLAYEPNQGNQLSGPNANPSSFVAGNSYSFSNDGYNCKTWSLNAYIK